MLCSFDSLGTCWIIKTLILACLKQSTSTRFRTTRFCLCFDWWISMHQNKNKRLDLTWFYLSDFAWDKLKVKCHGKHRLMMKNDIIEKSMHTNPKMVVWCSIELRAQVKASNLNKKTKQSFSQSLSKRRFSASLPLTTGECSLLIMKVMFCSKLFYFGSCRYDPRSEQEPVSKRAASHLLRAWHIAAP